MKLQFLARSIALLVLANSVQAETADCRALAGAPQSEIVDCFVASMQYPESFLLKAADAQLYEMGAVAEARLTYRKLARDLLDTPIEETLIPDFLEGDARTSFRPLAVAGLTSRVRPMVRGLTLTGEYELANQVLIRMMQVAGVLGASVAEAKDDSEKRKLAGDQRTIVRNAAGIAADSGYTDLAMQFVESVHESIRPSLLRSIARHQAENGNAEGAVATVERIRVLAEDGVIDEAGTQKKQQSTLLSVVKALVKRRQFADAINVANSIIPDPSAYDNADRAQNEIYRAGLKLQRAWESGELPGLRVIPSMRLVIRGSDTLARVDRGQFTVVTDRLSDRDSSLWESSGAELYTAIAEHQIEIGEFAAALRSLDLAEQSPKFNSLDAGKLRFRAGDLDGAMRVLKRSGLTEIRTLERKSLRNMLLVSGDLRALVALDKRFRAAGVELKFPGDDVLVFLKMADISGAEAVVDSNPARLRSSMRHFVRAYAKSGRHGHAMRVLDELRDLDISEEHLFWALASAPKTIAAIEFHACDRLAASPTDRDSFSPGVAYEDLDATAAVKACSDALRQRPRVRHYEFQLGRALHKAGRFAEARTWTQRAAEEGHAAAMSALAFMYLQGQPAEMPDLLDGQNDFLAAKWYRKAALLGDPPAQHSLAWMYHEGRYLEKDTQRARRWAALSAQQQYAPAVALLKEMNTLAPSPAPQPPATATADLAAELRHVPPPASAPAPAPGPAPAEVDDRPAQATAQAPLSRRQTVDVDYVISHMARTAGRLRATAEQCSGESEPGIRSTFIAASSSLFPEQTSVIEQAFDHNYEKRKANLAGKKKQRCREKELRRQTRDNEFNLNLLAGGDGN